VEYLLRSSGVAVSRLQFRGAHKLRKATLGLVAQCASEIVWLDLGKCRQVENRQIQQILERCVYLEYLYLDGCVKISDSAFNALHFVPLRVLSLAGLTQISPASLVRLLLLLDRLETVDFSHCRAAVDASVLWSIFDAAQTDRLRHAHLGNTAVLLSDAAFLQYPASLHVPLTTLLLPGTQGAPARFSDAALYSLARLCGPTLVELSLAWNSAISDAGLQALAKISGRLLRVDLSNT
jgi:hypothetical protein